MGGARHDILRYDFMQPGSNHLILSRQRQSNEKAKTITTVHQDVDDYCHKLKTKEQGNLGKPRLVVAIGQTGRDAR